MKIINLNIKSFFLGIVMMVGLAACNSGGNQNEGDAVAVDGVAEPGPTPVESIQDGTLGVGIPVYVQQYMDVKNALFNDNYEQAKQAASDFNKTLQGLNGTETMLSDAQKKELQQSANKLAQAKDIASMRNQFSAVSGQLYQVVQNKDMTNEKLYWQHCPMAMNGKGANWLSMEEQVQNPYMGQKMPRCGSVQETIN